MCRCLEDPMPSKEVNLIAVLLVVTVWAVMAVDAAWGGTIKGTVRLTGQAVEQKKITLTIDQYYCGKEQDAEDIILAPDKGIRNVVVSLQAPPPGAKWKEPLPPVEIDQNLCRFVPHVVVAPVGGTVNFLNTDRLLHNLHSISKENLIFNRAQPKGRTIPITFKTPEIIQVDCDLHAWMRAWVVVADHPFYAITNDMGEFILDNVPQGRYTLWIWQESFGTMTMDVTVEDKNVTSVTIEMSKTGMAP